MLSSSQETTRTSSDENPGYGEISLKEQLAQVFPTTPNHRHRDFEEVRLPFDAIERDYVEGELLAEALTEQLEALDYSAFSVPVPETETGYEIRAVKNTPKHEAAYIGFEGESSGHYSHLRLDIGAPTEEALEGLYDDLDALEAGLDAYFRSGVPTATDHYAVTSASD